MSDLPLECLLLYLLLSKYFHSLILVVYLITFSSSIRLSNLLSSFVSPYTCCSCCYGLTELCLFPLGMYRRGPPQLIIPAVRFSFTYLTHAMVPRLTDEQPYFISHFQFSASCPHNVFTGLFIRQVWKRINPYMLLQKLNRFNLVLKCNRRTMHHIKKCL